MSYTYKYFYKESDNITIDNTNSDDINDYFPSDFFPTNGNIDINNHFPSPTNKYLYIYKFDASDNIISKKEGIPYRNMWVRSLSNSTISFDMDILKFQTTIAIKYTGANELYYKNNDYHNNYQKLTEIKDSSYGPIYFNDNFFINTYKFYTVSYNKILQSPPYYDLSLAKIHDISSYLTDISINTFDKSHLIFNKNYSGNSELFLNIFEYNPSIINTFGFESSLNVISNIYEKTRLNDYNNDVEIYKNFDITKLLNKSLISQNIYSSNISIGLFNKNDELISTTKNIIDNNNIYYNSDNFVKSDLTYVDDVPKLLLKYNDFNKIRGLNCKYIYFGEGYNNDICNNLMFNLINNDSYQYIYLDIENGDKYDICGISYYMYDVITYDYFKQKYFFNYKVSYLDYSLNPITTYYNSIINKFTYRFALKNEYDIEQLFCVVNINHTSQLSELKNRYRFYKNDKITIFDKNNKIKYETYLDDNLGIINNNHCILFWEDIIYLNNYTIIDNIYQPSSSSSYSINYNIEFNNIRYKTYNYSQTINSEPNNVDYLLFKINLKHINTPLYLNGTVISNGLKIGDISNSINLKKEISSDYVLYDKNRIYNNYDISLKFIKSDERIFKTDFDMSQNYFYLSDISSEIYNKTKSYKTYNHNSDNSLQIIFDTSVNYINFRNNISLVKKYYSLNSLDLNNIQIDSSYIYYENDDASFIINGGNQPELKLTNRTLNYLREHLIDVSFISDESLNTVTDICGLEEIINNEKIINKSRFNNYSFMDSVYINNLDDISYGLLYKYSKLKIFNYFPNNIDIENQDFANLLNEIFSDFQLVRIDSSIDEIVINSNVYNSFTLYHNIATIFPLYIIYDYDIIYNNQKYKYDENEISTVDPNNYDVVFYTNNDKTEFLLFKNIRKLNNILVDNPYNLTPDFLTDKFLNVRLFKDFNVDTPEKKKKFINTLYLLENRDKDSSDYDNVQNFANTPLKDYRYQYDFDIDTLFQNIDLELENDDIIYKIKTYLFNSNDTDYIDVNDKQNIINTQKLEQLQISDFIPRLGHYYTFPTIDITNISGTITNTQKYDWVSDSLINFNKDSSLNSQDIIILTFSTFSLVFNNNITMLNEMKKDVYRYKYTSISGTKINNFITGSPLFQTDELPSITDVSNIISNRNIYTNEFPTKYYDISSLFSFFTTDTSFFRNYDQKNTDISEGYMNVYLKKINNIYDNRDSTNNIGAEISYNYYKYIDVPMNNNDVRYAIDNTINYNYSDVTQNVFFGDFDSKTIQQISGDGLGNLYFSNLKHILNLLPRYQGGTLTQYNSSISNLNIVQNNNVLRNYSNEHKVSNSFKYIDYIDNTPIYNSIINFNLITDLINNKNKINQLFYDTSCNIHINDSSFNFIITNSHLFTNLIQINSNIFGFLFNKNQFFYFKNFDYDNVKFYDFIPKNNNLYVSNNKTLFENLNDTSFNILKKILSKKINRLKLNDTNRDDIDLNNNILNPYFYETKAYDHNDINKDYNSSLLFDSDFLYSKWFLEHPYNIQYFNLDQAEGNLDNFISDNLYFNDIRLKGYPIYDNSNIFDTPFNDNFRDFFKTFISYDRGSDVKYIVRESDNTIKKQVKINLKRPFLNDREIFIDYDFQVMTKNIISISERKIKFDGNILLGEPWIPTSNSCNIREGYTLYQNQDGNLIKAYVKNIVYDSVNNQSELEIYDPLSSIIINEEYMGYLNTYDRDIINKLKTEFFEVGDVYIFDSELQDELIRIKDNGNFTSLYISDIVNDINTNAKIISERDKLGFSIITKHSKNHYTHGNNKVLFQTNNDNLEITKELLIKNLDTWDNIENFNNIDKNFYFYNQINTQKTLLNIKYYDENIKNEMNKIFGKDKVLGNFINDNNIGEYDEYDNFSFNSSKDISNAQFIDFSLDLSWNNFEWFGKVIIINNIFTRETQIYDNNGIINTISGYKMYDKDGKNYTEDFFYANISIYEYNENDIIWPDNNTLHLLSLVGDYNHYPGPTDINYKYAKDSLGRDMKDIIIKLDSIDIFDETYKNIKWNNEVLQFWKEHNNNDVSSINYSLVNEFNTQAIRRDNGNDYPVCKYLDLSNNHNPELRQYNNISGQLSLFNWNIENAINFYNYGNIQGNNISETDEEEYKRKRQILIESNIRSIHDELSYINKKRRFFYVLKDGDNFFLSKIPGNITNAHGEINILYPEITGLDRWIRKFYRNEYYALRADLNKYNKFKNEFLNAKIHFSNPCKYTTKVNVNKNTGDIFRKYNNLKILPDNDHVNVIHELSNDNIDRYNFNDIEHNLSMYNYNNVIDNYNNYSSHNNIIENEFNIKSVHIWNSFDISNNLKIIDKTDNINDSENYIIIKLQLHNDINNGYDDIIYGYNRIVFLIVKNSDINSKYIINNKDVSYYQIYNIIKNYDYKNIIKSTLERSNSIDIKLLGNDFDNEIGVTVSKTDIDYLNNVEYTVSGYIINTEKENIKDINSRIYFGTIVIDIYLGSGIFVNTIIFNNERKNTYKLVEQSRSNVIRQFNNYYKMHMLSYTPKYISTFKNDSEIFMDIYNNIFRTSGGNIYNKKYVPYTDDISYNIFNNLTDDFNYIFTISLNLISSTNTITNLSNLNLKLKQNKDQDIINNLIPPRTYNHDIYTDFFDLSYINQNIEYKLSSYKDISNVIDNNLTDISLFHTHIDISNNYNLILSQTSLFNNIPSRANLFKKLSLIQNDPKTNIKFIINRENIYNETMLIKNPNILENHHIDTSLIDFLRDEKAINTETDTTDSSYNTLIYNERVLGRQSILKRNDINNTNNLNNNHNKFDISQNLYRYYSEDIGNDQYRFSFSDSNNENNNVDNVFYYLSNNVILDKNFVIKDMYDIRYIYKNFGDLNIESSLPSNGSNYQPGKIYIQPSGVINSFTYNITTNWTTYNLKSVTVFNDSSLNANVFHEEYNGNIIFLGYHIKSDDNVIKVTLNNGATPDIQLYFKNISVVLNSFENPTVYKI